MSCHDSKTKQIAVVARNLIPDIKSEGILTSVRDINTAAKEAATQVVDKAIKLSKIPKEFKGFSDMFKGEIYNILKPDVTRSSEFILNQVSHTMNTLNFGEYNPITDKIVLGIYDVPSIKARLTKSYEDFSGPIDVIDEVGIGSTMSKIAELIESPQAKGTELHELVHAGAVAFMQENPDAKQTKQINKLFEEAKELIPTMKGVRNQYWRKNVDEFLAEALSNYELVEELIRLKPKTPKKYLANAYEILVSTVLGMLNIEGKVKDNMHDYLVDSFMSILEEKGVMEAEAKTIKKLAPSIAKAEAFNKRTLSDPDFDKKVKELQDLNTTDVSVENSATHTAMKPRVDTGKKHEVIVSQDLLDLNSQYATEPSPEALQKVLDQEIAEGIKDGNGAALDTPVMPKKPIGSSETEMTTDEAKEFYYDTDGTISKSQNISNALRELDKTEAGENFDAEWSGHLDSMLESITEFVGDVQEGQVKITKSSLQKVTQGQFDPNTADIDIVLGKREEGQEFRDKFDMGNQEIFTHELVHAGVDYVFNPGGIKAGKDPEIVNLVAEVKRLYNVARKNSKWQDLLPGELNHYTEHQKVEAERKHNYIFNNPHGNGVHEFMAHLLTNKTFNEAMKEQSVFIQKKDGDNYVDSIVRLFRNLLTKLSGLMTTRQGNITDAGTELIFKIMKGQAKAASKASDNQAYSMSDRSAEFMGKALDNVDETLSEGLDRVIGAVTGFPSKARTKDEKKAEADEYAKVFEEFVKRGTDVGLSRKEAIARITPETIAVIEAATVMAVKVIRADKATKSLVDAQKVLKSIRERREAGISMLRRIPQVMWDTGLLLWNVKNLAAGVRSNKEVAEVYSQTMRMLNLGEESMIRSILNDFMTQDDLYNEITDTILKLTHSVDGLRQNAYEGVLFDTKDWFGDIDINGDKNLLKVNEALTDVVLRTDIQSLGLDSKGLVGLLSNPDEVSKQIKELSSKMNKFQMRDIRSLAKYMSTGVGTISNAENIARGFGDINSVVSRNEVDEKLVEDIDKLVTLMALEATNAETKATLVDFLNGGTHELYKTDRDSRWVANTRLDTKKTLNKKDYTELAKHGVDQFILYSRGMQAASKKEMVNAPHNVIKGYVKETYNSKDVALEIFSMSERAQKESEGYEFIHRVKSYVPGTPTQGLFRIKDSMSKRADGALGLQSTTARGTTILDIINRDIDSITSGGTDTEAKGKIFKKNMRKLEKQFMDGTIDDNISPMYNEKGAIINFRIGMSHAEKRDLLDMETKGTQNIARSFGTVDTATITRKSNKRLLQVLHKDFRENFKDNPDAYVVIKPSSPMSALDYGLDVTKNMNDSDYERMWARLPDGTKEDANVMFNSGDGSVDRTKGITVRKDLVQQLFGYDEQSIVDFKAADKMSVTTKAKARKYEKVWQDVMQIAKGNIVIKTSAVLIGNLTSNAKILAYMGVNPIKGSKLIGLAGKELKRYEADKKELKTLERQQLSGQRVSNSRILELRKEIADNTVAPLIEAGLYQSVVEDVSTVNDTNRVSEWFNNKRDELVTNETANTALQYLFLTEKTKPYQAMLKATQVSDFYFRYAQYYDAVDNKGKTKKEAMRDTVDNYINYEAPLNKLIRYGDSMGPFHFVQYFTKIQRVIKKIVLKSPGRVGIDIAQQFILGDQDDILDQSILDKGLKTYNPFSVFGALWESVSPSGIEWVAKIVS